MSAVRVVVACINWGHPDSPHAMSYVLRDGEAHAEVFHTTWREAIERAFEIAARFKVAADRRVGR